MKKFFVCAAALCCAAALTLTGCPDAAGTSAGKSSDAALKSLSVEPGALNPEFAAETTEYTAAVANTVASVTVTGAANHEGAVVTGGGEKTLNVGENPITLTVTAEDGTTQKTYTVTVNRAGTADEPAVVSARNLSGLIKAPVKYAAPDTSFPDQIQYTGTIAWQTEDGSAFSGTTFAASTVYQAVVTLTAKTGYTFTGVEADSFTYTGATVTNAAGSGTVIIVFPATGAAGAVQSFSSLADMSTWLDEQEANSATEPYEVALTGVALSGLATTTPADPLGALFAAFHGKYAALDLSGCTGTEIAGVGATDAQARPDRDKLVSLILPDTLTTIGANAFQYTTGLVSVNLSRVTSIGNSAFDSCTALTSADLSGVTGSNLGAGVFSNCTALGSVELSDSLTTVSATLFWGCSSLAVVDLPASVALIDFMSFQSCSGLSALIIRRTEGTVTLGNSVFYDNPKLFIYVPDELVDTYKAKSGWSSHASEIKGHSELPQ